ncbi:MAG: hypothetical protein HY525_10435 [Betaproteobacteria bacterium]|nr:hypothetical protein [Betaproteobacteria bacterium]
MQSLAAWLNLCPEEELWLEVSEDYSILSENTALDAQVKASRAAAGPTKYSLQSKDVREAMGRFWVRAESDPRRRLVFIANGGAAREHGCVFPSSLPGLIYWGHAARDADTKPLRDALAGIFKGDPIGEWIASEPSDADLRRRLLTRIEWALNAEPLAEISEQLLEQISGIYMERGLPVIGAKVGQRALLDVVFEVASLPNADDRRLTPMALHRTIEEALEALSVAKLMGAATRQEAPFKSALVTELGDERPVTALRAATVRDIVTRATGEAVLWLHGAHGVGKSTLARLLARSHGGRWLALDLRSVNDDVSVLTAWRDLIRTIAADGLPSGVIIDDLDVSNADALGRRVGVLAQMIGAKGGRLIITSQKEPSPAKMPFLGATASAVFLAPYFSEDDVEELIRHSNRPAEQQLRAWALFIRMSSGGGHPLLVAAKVASLSARGWPRDGLIEDIGSPSEAVRATRDEARVLLLTELSKLDSVRSLDAGQLLRRVAAIFDRVDEDLVLRLAKLSPTIGTAGDALAILRGSWLEALPNGDLRISPLIADITSDVPAEQTQLWRRAAAEYWLGRRVLNERTLPLCFWNAFIGQHDWVLLKLCQVIQSQKPEVLRGAAAFLSPMTALRTDQAIYSSHEAVNADLRLLQFEVANAVESDSAAGIASRLLVELDALTIPDIQAVMTVIASSKVLMADRVRILPTDLIEYGRRMRQFMPRVRELGAWEGMTATQQAISRDFGEDIDFADFLVASALSKVRNSAEFLAVIEALDRIDIASRNGILNASASIFDGLSVFAGAGWTRDQLEERDMAPALAAYERATDIVGQWGRSDLMIELACALSVIRDEGLSDIEGAIAIVDRGIARFGPSPALIRQKAKVYGHHSRDDEAIQLILSVEDTVGGASKLDRGLALRDGGVSAARASRFSDAARLFAKAHEAIRANGGHEALAAGLFVDRAMALWDGGDRKGGLLTLADAYDALKHIEQSASRQNERAHQFARAVGGLFFHDLDLFPLGARPVVAYGGASALSLAKEELANIDLKPLADNWRVLALIEAQCGFDVGINARSLAAQSGPVNASIEALIAMARYGNALHDSDVSKAITAGVVATFAARAAAMAIRSSAELAHIDPSVTAGATIATMRSDPTWRNAVLNVLVDVLVFHRLSGTWSSDVIDRLRQPCAEAFGSPDMADGLLKAALGLYALSAAAPFPYSVAAASGRMDEQLTDAVRRYDRDMILVGHIAQSLARRALESMLVPFLERGWRDVLERQRFRLRSPAKYCPAIEEAVAALPKDGLRAAARLIIAAAPAVGEVLSESWEVVLRQAARLH